MVSIQAWQHIATHLQETSILRFKKQIFHRKLKSAYCISESKYFLLLN